MKHLFNIRRALGLVGFIAAVSAASAQTASFTANQTTYDPAGGNVTFTSSLSYSATPTAYAFSVQLPAGWSFVSQSLGSGLSAAASPSSGDSLLEWAFSGFPATQLSWTFTVSYPAGLTGDQTTTVTTAQYRSPTTNLTVSAITLTRAVPVAPSITSQPQSQTVTTGDSVSFSVGASGTSPLSYQWQKNGASIGGATNSTYTIGSAQSGDAGSYTVVVTNSVNSATSNAATLTVNAPSPTPRFTSQPQSQTVDAGASVTFRAGAAGATPLSYQWYRNNVAIVGATGDTLTISSARSGDAGTYTVAVWNGSGSVTSNGATLSVNTGPVSTRFVNIATRAYATTGNGVAIGGFVITGNDAKQVLMRAVGPTLTTQGLGQAEVLTDPMIELHKGSATLATNDNWGDNANRADIVSTGARIGATPFASGDTTSAALLMTLQPGVYSFIAQGKNATSGIVLVEVYDAD